MNGVEERRTLGEGKSSLGKEKKEGLGGNITWIKREERDELNL